MCGIHAWISSCQSANKTGEEDVSWLKRRGPDGVHTVSLLNVEAACEVHLTASVLKMRTEWQPQPVLLATKKPEGNTAAESVAEDPSSSSNSVASGASFMAWNGEIYEVAEESEDDPSFLGNDTKYIALRLQESLQGSLKEETKAIANVLASLTNAEYSICIITNHAIWYARDPWGRRSLMVNTKRSEFQISSVATHISDGSLWNEVPPGILYHYQISSAEIISVPFLSVASPQSIVPADADTASATLEMVLDKAVQRRLQGHTSCSVLFSGGLDSTLVAALALRYCSKVTLLTVSFVDKASSEDPEAADTITAKTSFEELQQLYPNSNISWNHRVVTYDEVEAASDQLGQLIYPKSTVMDWNIATALWFAASVKADRLLLSGLGADELLGGYRRHKQASEVRRDQERLWERNLGRDDRILSDHGTEVRFPYLDTHVVEYCRSVQDFVLQENKRTSTDKATLRMVARRMKLPTAASATKRAIQFGSRIAHVSDTKRFGSRRKATATAPVERTSKLDYS